MLIEVILCMVLTCSSFGMALDYLETEAYYS